MTSLLMLSLFRRVSEANWSAHAAIRVRLGHWAMSAECPVYPKTDISKWPANGPFKRSADGGRECARLTSCKAGSAMTEAQIAEALPQDR